MKSEKLIQSACEVFKITKDEFVNGGRWKKIVQVREIVCGVLLESGLKNSEVAKLTGLDRSTTYYYDYNFQTFRKMEADYQRMYENVLDKYTELLSEKPQN